MQRSLGNLMQVVLSRASLLGILFALIAWVTWQGAIAKERTEKSSSDWAWWRGPGRMGEATTEKPYPVQWSETEHVVWRADLPGRGHGSPIVVGDRVYVAICDEQTGRQGMIALDRSSGEKIWEKTIHESGAMSKNQKSSGASSTPACDGQRVYINFANSDKVVLTALELNGEEAWRLDVSQYQVHQGYGASPAIYEDLVYSVADTKGGGAIVAAKRSNGEIVWRQERRSNPNYASPIVLRVAGRDQLILTGLDQIISYDPRSGEVLWEQEGATTECVTTTVTDGKHVYSSGGYPKNHLAAVAGDGSGKIAWETADRIYVPSLLFRDGYLYGVLDAGIAACWDAATGEEMWKGRLGGDFSASPVLAGDHIYCINEIGKTYVWEASPKGLKVVAVNELGHESFATPTLCDGKVYLRVAYREEETRREQLVCIGMP